MKGGIIPDKTAWLAVKMIEIVRAGNANEEDLFAGTASNRPAVVRVVWMAG